MITKNVFDYLETSFNKIFCKRGLLLLESSFIVGGVSVLISLAFWGVLGYCFYYVFTKDLFDLSNYLYASVWILGTLIFSVFEYSFYAIIITKKFQDSEGKNRISFGQDIQIWWHAFGTYFQYITYFSSILFLGIILLILGGVMIYLTIGGWVTLYVFFALWVYLYVGYRLSISWYSILFGTGRTTWTRFWDGWNLLENRVYSTFKKVFFFMLIVGIAASISSYIAQLIIPDFSHIIGELTTKLEALKGINPDMEHTFGVLRDIFGSILIPGIYTLVVFSFFSKISFILQMAMSHTFLTDYYLDILDEKHQ